MQVAPYLFFEGRCEEAIAYYEAKLGAERLDLDSVFGTVAAAAPAPATT